MPDPVAFAVKEGVLSDAVTGEPIEINGTPVKLDELGLVPKDFMQEQIDKTVQKRLTEAKRKFETEKKQKEETTQQLITELQSQLERSTSPEHADTLQQRISVLEEQLMTQEEIAQKRQQHFKQESEKKLKTIEEQSKGWESRFKQTKLKNDIYSSLSAYQPINPDDFVDHLKDRQVWEFALDPETQKPTGEQELKFRIRYIDDEGKPAEGVFPVDKAIELTVASHPHWIRANSQTGSGTMPSFSGSSGVPRYTGEQVLKMGHEDFNKFQKMLQEGRAVLI